MDGIDANGSARGDRWAASGMGLTGAELMLLDTLVGSPDSVIPFDVLRSVLWNVTDVRDPARLHAVIDGLKTKVNRHAGHMSIETVEGRGLRFTMRSAFER